MTVRVVAFDGLLAETLDLRADAIMAAAAAERLLLVREEVLAALPGRSLFECVELLCQHSTPPRGDATLCELLALRAQRHVTDRMAQGVTLSASMCTWIDAQRATGARLVLRADSLRRDVERVLQLTDLEFAFAFTRCADDQPRTAGASTLRSAYIAITQRLDRSAAPMERSALEVSTYAATIAAPFVATVSVVTDFAGRDVP